MKTTNFWMMPPANDNSLEVIVPERNNNRSHQVAWKWLWEVTISNSQKNTNSTENSKQN